MKNQLDCFGKLFVEEVRDQTFDKFIKLFTGKLKGEGNGELHKKIATLSPEAQLVLQQVVGEMVDETLFRILRLFEDEAGGWMIANDKVRSLADESDGLSGELYSEDGWLARFSRFNTYNFCTNEATADDEKQEDVDLTALNADLKIKHAQRPCTAKDLDDIERKYGFHYPQDLRQFLLRCNGGTPAGCDTFQQDYIVDQFLPVRHGGEMGFEATMEDIAEWFPDHLVPFAIDVFGNYFAFDKESGTIYFYDTEEEEDDATTFLANSFTAFITNLHPDESEEEDD